MSGNEFENQDEPDRRLETDDDSDTDSVAELEYNTWNDACAWEFRSASGNYSPGSFQNPPTDIMQNTRYCGDMLMVTYNIFGSVNEIMTTGCILS